MSRDPLYADPKLAAFKAGETTVPPKNWLWPLYGAGFENLGVNDAPIQVLTPTPGADELLVRHDAVGLCFSDTKVIKAGETHPRLVGRNMKANPVVLGHEVALTVIQVGANLKGQFKRGDRFIVQADVYYRGVNLAYGYALQGGLSQYNVVGKEVLEGDEGCYLLPVKPETGYAQAALTEPWACVTASYDVIYRVGWKAGGKVLVATGKAAQGEYALGAPFAGGQPPAQVVTLGVSGMLLAELRLRAKKEGFTLQELGAPSAATVAEAKSLAGIGGYDDIVFLGADAALYEQLEPLAANRCILNLVGAQGLSAPAQVDVGRLHYDHLCLTGTESQDLSLAYEPMRTDLLAGGKSAFIGAAGPMGQMHVQRAMQAKASPSLMVATDLVPERLAVVATKYGQLIEAKKDTMKVVLRTPGALSAEAFNDSLMLETGGEGYDDLVVLVPVPAVIAGAVRMVAKKGVMNIFAGVSRGVKAAIDLKVVAQKGVRFTGQSGSAIRDLRNMLAAAEAGQLDPNLSVAAISGLKDVKKGLEGVVHQTFPGKIVIYPQVVDFPLTALGDLKSVLPAVYAKLGPHESWTVEAEAEFLKELLP